MKRMNHDEADCFRRPGLHDSDTDTHRPPKSFRQSQTSRDRGIEGNAIEGNTRDQLPTFVISSDVGRTAPESRGNIPSPLLETLQNSTYNRETSSTDSESVTSASIKAELALESPTRPFHNDHVFPQEISYTLSITYEIPVLLDPKLVRVVPIKGGYNSIERFAEQQVKSIDPRLSVSKELLLRHGTCEITTTDGNKEFYPLTSNDHWSEVCSVLWNYCRSGKVEKIHIDIFRDYFSLQTRIDGAKSFASIKRDEIEGLMKQSLDGGQYIPRTDLERITSIDTIRQIINEDNSLFFPLQDKEAFIRVVQNTARTLLAICVYSSLEMRCLKVLIDKGLSDTTLPLKKSAEKCHSTGCGANFKALLTHQGSFLAPMFNKMGEHFKLEPGVALPMQYYPVDKYRHASIVDHSASTGSSSISPERDTIPEKSSAYCGHGSFGNVYRVRLDPDHHRISMVRSSYSQHLVF